MTVRATNGLLRDMTEKEWDHQIFNSKNGLATQLGWRLTYHTLRSKGSTAGFPDRVLVRDRVIFLELKTETGKLSGHQRDWLNALLDAGAEAYVARPRDLQALADVLTARWRHRYDLEARTLEELGRGPPPG